MIRIMLRGLAAPIAALLALAAPAHAATAFTGLVVFGDSYLDSGNTFARTGKPPASRGDFEGRSMDGYDYADLLSFGLFGHEATASDLGGTNFALGGAKALATNAGNTDLAMQISAYNQYLTAHGASVDPNALYLLGFGTNDSAITQPLAQATVTLDAAAQAFADTVKALADRGARNILVADSSGFADRLPYAAIYDQALAADLAALNLPAGTRLMTFDFTSFLADIESDPGHYGLPALRTDTTCLAQNAVATQCAGYLKFDGAHPTAAIHAAIYQAINARYDLVPAAVSPAPEPAQWATLIGGLFAVGAVLRRARRRQSFSTWRTSRTAPREALVVSAA